MYYPETPGNIMETSMIAVLVLLALAAVSGPAEGLDYTWVSDGSSSTVMGTTSYEFGRSRSGFVNRVIVPGTSQSDQYEGGNTINLEIWIQDGCCHETVQLNSDDSVVALDSTDPGVHLDGGVDIFKAVYGTLFQPAGNALTTIYPGKGMCDIYKWSCCSLGTPCS